MIKWADQRNLSLPDKIDLAYQKAMNHTGFINEKLIYNPRKDIFKKFLEVLYDADLVIFDYVLLGWEFVPLDEMQLMHIEMEQIFLKIKEKFEPREPYVSINPKNIRVCRMRFLKNPKKVMDKYVDQAISTTIREIKEKNILSDYANINEGLIKFLNTYKVTCDQVKSDKENMSLLCDDQYLIIPQLDKGLYYTINGSRRYPLYTEAWHSTKNAVGETSFLYKVKSGNEDTQAYEGYLAAGIKISNNKKVYYIRHSGRIYNPLTMYEAFTINDSIVPKLSKINDPQLLEILNNTIEDYNEYKALHKGDNGIYERKDIIPLTNEIKGDDLRRLRSALIPPEALVDIITGYHQKDIKFDVYGSVFNALLKAGNSDAKYKSKPGDRYATIRAEKLSTTLVKNNYLTFSNQNTNPLDIFYLLGYKKSLGGKKTTKSTKEIDRFTNWKTYHLVDSISNRSESTIGIVSSLLCHVEDDKIVMD